MSLSCFVSDVCMRTSHTVYDHIYSMHTHRVNNTCIQASMMYIYTCILQILWFIVLLVCIYTLYTAHNSLYTFTVYTIYAYYRVARPAGQPRGYRT